MASSQATNLVVVALPSNRVTGYWPHVREFIWPAFERFPGEVDEAGLLERLLTGDAQLWVVWDDGLLGGAITSITNYAEFKAVRLVALGGERFEDWREEMDRLLDKFCEVHGCSRIEFYGRIGWSKRLPNYRINRIMMSRDYGR